LYTLAGETEQIFKKLWHSSVYHNLLETLTIDKATNLIQNTGGKNLLVSDDNVLFFNIKT